jgi:hypothetical protein
LKLGACSARVASSAPAGTDRRFGSIVLHEHVRS